MSGTRSEESLQGMEQKLRGGVRGGVMCELRGRLQGERSPPGKVPRCPPIPHHHHHPSPLLPKLLALPQPIRCQLRLPPPRNLACAKCLLWLLAQWKCISPHDNVTPPHPPPPPPLPIMDLICVFNNCPLQTHSIVSKWEWN